jgi:hypothetical protein
MGAPALSSDAYWLAPRLAGYRQLAAAGMVVYGRRTVREVASIKPASDR